MDADQSGALNAAVTRGAFAKMLTSYSTFRESVSSQGAVGAMLSASRNARRRFFIVISL